MEGEIKTMISTVLTSHHVIIIIQNLNTLRTKIPSYAISALEGCRQHSMSTVGSEGWMVGLSSRKAANGGR